MSLIDSRGRLFGKANLIDVAVVGVVFGMVALAFGAFRTFQPPPPKISTVTPNQIAEKQRATLHIVGEGIRPFLEVRFGGTGSSGLVVEDPTSARVLVPDLPPGIYDVTLLDKGRPVFSAPKALTVMGERGAASLVTDVQVVGTFVALSQQDASTLKVGAEIFPASGAGRIGSIVGMLPPTAETQPLRVSQPREERGLVIKGGVINIPVPDQVRARAIVRVHCTIIQGECRAGDATISQGQLIALATSATEPGLRFQIDEVRPADASLVFPPAGAAIATLKVRFAASPEILGAINAGDIDIADRGVVAESDRAVLLQIGNDRERATALVTPEGILRRSMQVEQSVVAFTGTLRVPVVFDTTGWMYKDRAVKVGAAFHFETVSGGMSGLIVGMSVAKQ